MGVVNGGAARACLGSTVDEVPSSQIVRGLENNGKALDSVFLPEPAERLHPSWGPSSLYRLTDHLGHRARAGEDRFPREAGRGRLLEGFDGFEH